MEQGNRLARVQPGRRSELQHRKAEGVERPRLDQAETEPLDSGEGFGTVAQHHHLAGLEAMPCFMAGIGAARWCAAADWRCGAGSTAIAPQAAVGATGCVPAIGFVFAVSVALATTIPVTSAVAVPVPATVPVTSVTTVPTPVTSAVAVPATIPITAAVPVPVTSAISVPMAALIGEGRADQMMEDIDRGEAGACKAQGHEA